MKYRYGIPLKCFGAAAGASFTNIDYINQFGVGIIEFIHMMTSEYTFE